MRATACDRFGDRSERAAHGPNAATHPCRTEYSGGYTFTGTLSTPTGVVVPLASPGTDQLGRSGVDGVVDRHFADRFGAAILISVIDGAIQGATQSRSQGGTVIYNPNIAKDVMTEVLKSTVNIPPSIRKQNGDRIQILVARDLDFRSVYELKALAHAN